MRILPLIAATTLAGLALVPGANAAVKPTCAKDGVCFTKTINGAKKTITVTGTAGNDKIVRVQQGRVRQQQQLAHRGPGPRHPDRRDRVRDARRQRPRRRRPDQPAGPRPAVVRPRALQHRDARRRRGQRHDLRRRPRRRPDRRRGPRRARRRSPATISCARSTARPTCCTAGSAPTPRSATPSTRPTASRADLELPGQLPGAHAVLPSVRVRMLPAHVRSSVPCVELDREEHRRKR